MAPLTSNTFISRAWFLRNRISLHTGHMLWHSSNQLNIGHLHLASLASPYVGNQMPPRYLTMPEMLISDALICDLDLKRVTNMLSATRVNTTRHWYAVAYGK